MTQCINGIHKGKMRALHRSDSHRDPSRIRGLIAHLAVFSELAEAQVLELATRAHLLPLARGAALVRRGDTVPGVMGVSYGLLKLAARGTNGEERVLRLLGAGESFGAASVLLGRPCPVDVVAAADTLVIGIAPAPILELLDRDPKFARRLLIALAERTLGLLSEFADNALHRGIQRLAAYVESLARPYNGSGSHVATLPVAKSLVASRLGMKKETLSRLLHELAEDGLVSVSGREITILDRARLAELARNGSHPLTGEGTPAGRVSAEEGRALDRVASAIDSPV